ncbi:hypothetical protein NDU88_003112 [Pleurodeles waltl]|uniref:Uncharacterized protein n=1 Tax=Pleurodeles waltl TaxID=8319 RepID=A0AAV7TN47_PLEWA|nr:hypothetical protein NDU88_003112 [Pleurodeles waltl]
MVSPVRNRDLRPLLRFLRGTPVWGPQFPAPSQLQYERAPPRPQLQDPGAQALNNASPAPGLKIAKKNKPPRPSAPRC